MVDAADEVGVSAISCFEIALLVARGRIALDRDVDEWLRGLSATERVSVVPMTCAIGRVAAGLDRDTFPGDTADRLVYATARSLGAPLVTKDRGIRSFDPAGVVW